MKSAALENMFPSWLHSQSDGWNIRILYTSIDQVRDGKGDIKSVTGPRNRQCRVRKENRVILEE